ncbi:hypothetical protein K7X08_010379 [Anisodus acutangulus]|uniref:CAP-Gly domain-containing linker protein 1 n=1 Tax=Anisodus acutangulus TaxID=402998 RepID=A0A9Q1N4Q6_9SOLA|nr:hypothetical protein K7X08_010379 [Anisodus acutangulus]
MANSHSTPPVPASSTSPLSTRKENVTSASSKIAELTESRQELLNRIQSLKTDLQSWRYKLDGQVKVYRDELSELKKSLNVEVDQLRSEFQELKTTLQQQQEDVTTSLRNLGLQDAPEETEEIEDVKPDNNEENAQDLPKDCGKDTE